MNTIDAAQVLGITEVTPEAVKKAYRAKSKEHHPDHGGDTAKFNLVAQANELLVKHLERVGTVGPRDEQFFTYEPPKVDHENAWSAWEQARANVRTAPGDLFEDPVDVFTRTHNANVADRKFRNRLADCGLHEADGELHVKDGNRILPMSEAASDKVRFRRWLMEQTCPECQYSNGSALRGTTRTNCRSCGACLK